MTGSFRQPGEWTDHRACWVAFPSHEELWEDQLPAARAAFLALCRGIVSKTSGSDRPLEKLEVLVRTPRDLALATEALSGAEVRFHPVAYGDIWLRDTAPIFVKSDEGKVAAARFAFNGWGKKYLLDGDQEVGDVIAAAAGFGVFRYPFVLEGGSIEVDGEGTGLTTRQCLLNPNRNPGLDEDGVARALAESLGITKLLWLDEGLAYDHTDGHIDTIARFIAPGRVMCMRPAGREDPNYDVLLAIREGLADLTDAAGRRLEVVQVPSPGEVTSREGDLMPASYVNFYLGNHAVVVPTYGQPSDEEAVRAVGACFPDRRTFGVDAKAILAGGGAFHCITQQEPQETES